MCYEIRTCTIKNSYSQYNKKCHVTLWVNTSLPQCGPIPYLSLKRASYSFCVGHYSSNTFVIKSVKMICSLASTLLPTMLVKLSTVQSAKDGGGHFEVEVVKKEMEEKNWKRILHRGWSKRRRTYFEHALF